MTPRRRRRDTEVAAALVVVSAVLAVAFSSATIAVATGLLSAGLAVIVASLEPVSPGDYAVWVKLHVLHFIALCWMLGALASF